MFDDLPIPCALGKFDDDSGMEWRPVPDWPGYEVREDGKVRSRGKILKPWVTGTKRWQIRLYNKGKAKAFFTYKLVALAFIGKSPFEGAEIAHWDDDSINNNHWSNLRWTTHRENINDKMRNGLCASGLNNGSYTKPHRRRKGEDNGASVLNERQIAEIRSAQKGGRSLADLYGVSYTTIKDIRRRKTWRHVP